MLKYQRVLQDNELLVDLEGRLDTDTSPELHAMLLTEALGAESLTLDMAKVDYISSAGLRVLLNAKKLFKNQFKVVNANETIMDIFDMTGFTDILNIE